MARDNWPSLAWLARCRRGVDMVQVYHGRGVETTEHWFCEAVWDGPYPEGRFDETDLVFGSGARVRDGELLFVSSGSTVDRLHVVHAGPETVVSNSLVGLASHRGLCADTGYLRYPEDFQSIVFGLDAYEKDIRLDPEPLQLVYFYNLLWTGGGLVCEEKPFPCRDFSSFSKYRAFLRDSLARLFENMGSPHRSQSFRPLGTLSRGYDSPAVAVLAAEVGLKEAITFAESRDGVKDSGVAIGERLGIRTIVRERDSWREEPLGGEAPEVPFLAADAGGEDVYFHGVAEKLEGRVLLTGFHGDRVWSPETTFLGPEIRRGDHSGLSLCEYRLWVGFVHCPVPFFAVRQIADVQAISSSPAMQPWSVDSGYSRPICRRIVEEAGIPREAFGLDKQASSVLLLESPDNWSEESLANLRSWAVEQAVSRGTRLFLWSRVRLVHSLQWVVRKLVACARVLSRLIPGYWSRRLRKRFGATRSGAMIRRAGRRWYLLRQGFPWALERAKKRYE